MKYNFVEHIFVSLLFINFFWDPLEFYIDYCISWFVLFMHILHNLSTHNNLFHYYHTYFTLVLIVQKHHITLFCLIIAKLFIANFFKNRKKFSSKKFLFSNYYRIFTLQHRTLKVYYIIYKQDFI